jgi:hypothetical protein
MKGEVTHLPLTKQIFNGETFKFDLDGRQKEIREQCESCRPCKKSLAEYYKPVQLNNSCEFLTFALGPHARNIPIKWSQNWEPRKETYTLVIFDISPKGNATDWSPKPQSAGSC